MKSSTVKKSENRVGFTDLSPNETQYLQRSRLHETIVSEWMSCLLVMSVQAYWIDSALIKCLQWRSRPSRRSAAQKDYIYNENDGNESPS